MSIGQSILRVTTKRMKKCNGCSNPIDVKRDHVVVARKEKWAKKGKKIKSEDPNDFFTTIPNYHLSKRCLKDIKFEKVTISKDVTLDSRKIKMLQKCGIKY